MAVLLRPARRPGGPVHGNSARIAPEWSTATATARNCRSHRWTWWNPSGIVVRVSSTEELIQIPHAHAAEEPRGHYGRDRRAIWRRAPNVIEPARFQEFSDRLLASTSRHADPNDLAADCEEVIEQFVDDEPDDAGFYAFGAVVSVFFACCALRGDADGGLNAAKRFLDLTGAADDDGAAGLFEMADDFVPHTPQGASTHPVFCASYLPCARAPELPFISSCCRT